MTALNDLFPDGPRTDHEADVVLDDHHTARRLRETIGDPRGAVAAVRPVADADRLAAVARQAARTAETVAAPAATPARTARRRSRRRDPWAVGAAGLAVVALVTAGTVGGIQMATASPAASALESLEADEAAAQNAHQSLTTTRDRLLADIDAQSDAAVQLRGALTSTATAVDPAGQPDEPPMPVTDADALAAAVAAVDAYAAGLAEVPVPELPAEYARADVDENSLVDVGGAIDRVQEELVALDAAVADARTVRSHLDALRSPVDAAVGAYADSFVGAAGAAVERYPDAEETLRTAVTDAAARVAAADLWTAEGQATLAAYRDAVVALAADQLRFEIELEREQAEQDAWTPGQQQDGGEQPPADGGTTPPPTTPTTPPGTGTPPTDGSGGEEAPEGGTEP